MSFELKVRETSSVTVVDVAGRITLDEGAGAMRNTLRQMASTGRKNILLNLSRISYLDSSGIGVPVSSFATLSSVGGQLKLTSLSDRVKDLLLITKLVTVLQVYDDENTALASFSGTASATPVASS
jgi:anti-sigma B factor antagonist